MLAKPIYSGIGHVLLFHRVCPDNGSEKSIWCKGLEVTPAYLEEVIRYFIDQKYEAISLDRLVEVLKQKKREKKYVVFTFDDGYVDNLIYAYPIFKKYNIPFAIYVTTGFVDRQAIMWTDALNDFVYSSDRIAFKLDNESFDFYCPSNKAKEDTLLKIRALIRGCDRQEGLERIKQIFSSCKNDPLIKTDELSFTWDQIINLSKDPLVTIGAHTVNHLLLNNLTRAVVKEEMLGSKERLEAKLNCEIRHLSYPYGGRGEIGKKEIEIAKECGFTTAVTTRSANVFLEHLDHLQSIPRFNMGKEVGAQKLAFLTSGFTHCIQNRFKRVVTL